MKIWAFQLTVGRFRHRLAQSGTDGEDRLWEEYGNRRTSKSLLDIGCTFNIDCIYFCVLRRFAFCLYNSYKLTKSKDYEEYIQDCVLRLQCTTLPPTTRSAAFSFEEDKSRTGHFQICVNDIPLVQWFRQKAHEWRNVLGITTPKQGDGMKIWICLNFT